MLISMCKPASFGKGKQEIQDPNIRKAYALDTKHFLSSFHPADHGILKSIENLMHSTSDVHAELYKLNIYSTGGHFKEHVDTPRASNMIGSLVVCLPCEHKGGSLIVKHEGKQIEFDFSGNSKDIQWCAFYADCVHQVMPVTEGYRVTLTYNLYSQKALETMKVK